MTEAAPTWLQYASPIIALLGVWLGGWSLCLQRRDKRPRLKIQRGTAVLTAERPNGLNLSDPQEQYLVANPGERTVTVTAVHLLLNGEQRIPIINGRMLNTEGAFQPITFPQTLTAGQSIQLFTD